MSSLLTPCATIRVVVFRKPPPPHTTIFANYAKKQTRNTIKRVTHHNIYHTDQTCDVSVNLDADATHKKQCYARQLLKKKMDLNGERRTEIDPRRHRDRGDPRIGVTRCIFFCTKLIRYNKKFYLFINLSVIFQLQRDPGGHLQFVHKFRLQ